MSDLFFELENPGKQNRDLGMERSRLRADRLINNWSDTAYDFLTEYSKTHNEFMAEEVRAASDGLVPRPPNDRAWGAIFVKAAKVGLLKRKGYKQVMNAKAHCTPATLWEVRTA